MISRFTSARIARRSSSGFLFSQSFRRHILIPFLTIRVLFFALYLHAQGQPTFVYTNDNTDPKYRHRIFRLDKWGLDANWCAVSNRWDGGDDRLLRIESRCGWECG